MPYFTVGWGKIYHRSDSGVWTNHTPAGIVDANYRMMSVYAISPTEAYAVGYHYFAHGSIFYKWDGISWTAWNVTPPGAYHRANHISGASRNEIYIVFYLWSPASVVVWRGDYTGTGTIILSASNESYSGYTAGSDEFYLTSTGSPFLKKWNGTSWSNSSIGTPDGGYLNHIYGANNIYTTYGNNNKIYRGSWDTWNSDSSPTNFYMQTYQHESDIWAYGNKCWMTGWQGTTPKNPAIAYYDGTSWSTVLLTTRPDNNFYSGIVGADDSHILAVYNKGYAYFYDGSTWTEEAIGASFDVQDVDYAEIDTSLATRNIIPDYDYQYQTITDYEVAQDDPLSVRTMNDLCHNINHLKAHMMPKLISHIGTAEDKLTSKLGTDTTRMVMPFSPRWLSPGHDLMSIHVNHQRISGSGTTAWTLYIFHKFWIPIDGKVYYFDDIWKLRDADWVVWNTSSDSPTMSYRQGIVTATKIGKYVMIYPILCARNSDETTISSIISLDVSCTVQGAKI